VLPEFGQHSVHVWHLRLDQQPWQQHIALLSQQQRQRLESFRGEDLRRRYCVCHAGLRTVLSLYLGIDPQAIEFDVGEQGKPSIAEGDNPSGLTFNISHSGERAIFAIASRRAIGIDLEAVRNVSHLDGILKRYFCEDERIYCNSLGQDRLIAFFRLWTCKEALSKAMGLGLQMGLDKCAVCWGDQPYFTQLPEAYGVNWRPFSLEAAPGWIAALVIDDSLCQIDYFDCAAFF